MSYSNDPYAHAMNTANIWLHRVTESLGTDDRAFAARALRSWLHVVRDRVEVTTAAHLAAQLPELLRGVFYEGWVPARVPVGHSTAALIDEYARGAEVDPAEATALLGAVTSALAELFSPGQLDHVFTVLPAPMRAVLRGDDYDGPLAAAGRTTGAPSHPNPVR
ncbi:DUF2267 domain-containing protein [Nocardia stercoris]|nr:DUF2267 domain-containing protein [Nocardia stercoris]